MNCFTIPFIREKDNSRPDPRRCPSHYPGHRKGRKEVRRGINKLGTIGNNIPIDHVIFGEPREPVLHESRG
jgi:hypothetical protein